MRASVLLLLAGCAMSSPVESEDSPLDGKVTELPAGNGPLYVVLLTDEPIAFYGAPSVDGDVVGEIAPDATVRGTGRTQAVHGTTWVEVLFDGTTGWAEGRFLSERVESETFCADRDVSDLLIDLELAIREGSEERLFGDISPKHGLYVQYARTEAPVHLGDREAASRMMSGEEMLWGANAAGDPIVGSAADLVFSELGPALRNGSTSCNAIAHGDATYDVALESSFGNVNFYSIHREGHYGYDWITWVVGIEYVEGVPYVLSLHRFAWEP